MKKYKILLIMAFVAIIVLIGIGRATDAIQYYSVPTHSNEPTFKNGSHFIATKFKKPKRLSFICYISTVPEYENETWFHRVCGLPGDTILIKDGDLFVNGIDMDKSLNLKKRFVIHRNLVTPLNLDESDVMLINASDSVIANLETITHKDLIKYARKYVDYNEDATIKALYKQQWTAYNFGPYIVPAYTYFVLGDNRFAAMDSRFSGPVKHQNQLTTILGK